MQVKKLILEGFRNYEKCDIDFCEGINVISGQNAQGKTNLIEAIYYLASGRSFRQANDKELVNFNRDSACIRADIISGERNQTLEAQLFDGRRRQLFANNVKLKKAGELAGRLTAVVFCPDDIGLIKDGASVRRKLMDNAISQLRSGYVNALAEFNRLYDHKTRILRDHFEKPSLLELLDGFNIQLAEQSAQLIYYRSAFAEKLLEKAYKIHREFSGGREELYIRYKTVGDIDPKGKKPSALMPELMDHQKSHRESELRSGLCLSGAHKDDLEIEINGQPARKYASQGQARTASVSIKMAERDIHCDSKGEYPVLLLDDVLSELDTKRQEYVLGKITSGQVFITCCEDVSVREYACGKVMSVDNGNVFINAE